jgi:imidazolonepropionase
MGIKTTVRATRQISKANLRDACLKRLDQMLLHGTTTAEAKSGYGLNLEDEIKQLEAIREADEMHPVDLVPTFMGAHEIPEEYRSRKEDYIDLLIHKIIPEVRHQDLARFFDVFCEKGVFSVEETERLVQAAKAAGFGIKIHADEFTPLGGAELAAKAGAASADHLIAITDAGIEALAKSSTAATLLPGVSFFLMQEKRAPARRLIEAGAIVALATDFNPGSSMTESMLFVLQLGVFTLKMSIEEAVNAATTNGAYALGMDDEVGSLEVGKKMDLILCNIPNYLFLVYHLGVNPITHVIKNGRLVVRDGRLHYSPIAP